MLAFVLMIALALAMMVRFTGPQSAAEPVAAAEEVPANPTGLIIPVAGVSRAAITDTWGQSRDNGARPHQGTDIMAPAGTPVLAAAAGTIEKLFESGAGGHTLYVRSPDHRWSYYYAHLSAYADGIAAGTNVKAGDLIAYVGDTGNAGLGNYHLHFGMSRMAPGDGWWQGTPVNPYPMLVGRAGGR